MPILTPANPDEIIKIHELHDALCSIADALSAIDINDFDIDEENKRRFLAGRFWFDDYKRRVQTGILTVLVERLRALEPEIDSATKRLKERLQEMEDIVSALDLIQKVVLLVGQVVISGAPLGV
jgi:hypothetical protein